MPSTQNLLLELHTETQWPIEGTRGLRSILNEVNRFMATGDYEQNVYLNPATGRPPLLTTNVGQLIYTMPSNCRKVYRVGIDISGNNSSLFAYTNYYNKKPYAKQEHDFFFQNYQYTEVPIRSTETTRNADATITFDYYPGYTTDTYYLFYFIKPREISSANIQLDIPEQFHDIVVDGVLARIGKKEYGDANNWEYWKKQIVPKQYWSKMNSGTTQAKTLFVTQRPC